MDANYVNDTEAARLVGCSVSHLKKLRLYNPDAGPPFVRMGRKVLYPLKGQRSLETWLAARDRTPAPDDTAITYIYAAEAQIGDTVRVTLDHQFLIHDEGERARLAAVTRYAPKAQIELIKREGKHAFAPKVADRVVRTSFPDDEGVILDISDGVAFIKFDKAGPSAVSLSALTHIPDRETP